MFFYVKDQLNELLSFSSTSSNCYSLKLLALDFLFGARRLLFQVLVLFINRSSNHSLLLVKSYSILRCSHKSSPAVFKQFLETLMWFNVVYEDAMNSCPWIMSIVMYVWILSTSSSNEVYMRNILWVKAYQK